MERSFAKEIELLRLGKGETFNGEGILAVTKALLQSGVSYVGGYQGAPVSHLLDVLVQAKDLMGTFDALNTAAIAENQGDCRTAIQTMREAYELVPKTAS